MQSSWFFILENSWALGKGTSQHFLELRKLTGGWRIVSKKPGHLNSKWSSFGPSTLTEMTEPISHTVD